MKKGITDSINHHITTIWAWICITFLLLQTGCNQQGETVEPRGDRLFGVEVSMTASEEADEVDGFSNALAKAKELGIDFDHKSINWTSMEDLNPGEIIDPYQYLEIINYFYPLNNTAVYFTLLGPINTTVRDLPNDLMKDSFDEPALIARAKNIIDFIYQKMPDVDLPLFVVGNEIDIYLESHPAELDAFVTFFNEIKAHIKTKNADQLVATTVTLYGLTEGSLKTELINFLNKSSDAISVTYYPLDEGYMMKDPQVVHGDFEALCDLTDKPIYFQECGYPTSSANNSSEALQADFAEQVLTAWDRHADQIKVISWYQLTDWNQSDVDDYIAYLDLPGDQTPLKEYIRTLGLRNYDDAEADKEAYGVLKAGLEARGW